MDDIAHEAELIARLSCVAGRRVHWGVAESVSTKDGPYVRLSMISGQRDYNMSGPTRHTRRRLQLDAFGLTFSAVRSVADAARQALSGFRVVFSVVRIGGLFIYHETIGQERHNGSSAGSDRITPRNHISFHIP